LRLIWERERPRKNKVAFVASYRGIMKILSKVIFCNSFLSGQQKRPRKVFLRKLKKRWFSAFVIFFVFGAFPLITPFLLVICWGIQKTALTAVLCFWVIAL
jgi:hypothetical protein